MLGALVIGCSDADDVGLDAAIPVDAAATDASADASPDASTTKRVFVTSLAYSGNLKAAGNGSDGLDGADRLCTTHAMAASLGGTWKAWLSGVNTPLTNDAIDRITGSGPWFRTDGMLAFENRAGLMVSPKTSLQRDERGQVIDLPLDVWTGTDVGGRRSNSLCTDLSGPIGTQIAWANASSNTSGDYGDAVSTTGRWTDSGTTQCSTPRRIYCFEQ